MTNDELIRLLRAFGTNLNIKAITEDAKQYKITGIRKREKDEIEIILEICVDNDICNSDRAFLISVNKELNDNEKIDIEEAIEAKKHFQIDVKCENYNKVRTMK